MNDSFQHQHIMMNCFSLSVMSLPPNAQFGKIDVAESE